MSKKSLPQQPLKQVEATIYPPNHGQTFRTVPLRQGVSPRDQEVIQAVESCPYRFARLSVKAIRRGNGASDIVESVYLMREGTYLGRVQRITIGGREFWQPLTEGTEHFCLSRMDASSVLQSRVKKQPIPVSVRVLTRQQCEAPALHGVKIARKVVLSRNSKTGNHKKEDSKFSDTTLGISALDFAELLDEL